MKTHRLFLKALILFVALLFSAVTVYAGNAQVAAGYLYTVGLKTDGTAVATGSMGSHVESWTDILQVAGGGHHTVGLKADGTVVTVGYCRNGQCDVESWTDIQQVALEGRTP